jgi:hypothetical protein
MLIFFENCENEEDEDTDREYLYLLKRIADSVLQCD